MAYPTGLLSIVLEDIDRRLTRLKSQVQLVRTASAASDLASARIFDLFRQLKQERTGLSTAGATSGLAQYARDQKTPFAGDVVAEFTAVIAAIDGVTDWILANFPTDGSGFLLAQTWGPSGPVDRLFTPAALAGFRAQLDTLLATIN